MKILFAFIAFVVLAFGGILLLKNDTRQSEVRSPQQATAQTVEMVDGKQIINIKAKGGYFPMSIDAQSGVPTTLRVTTSGTFDCSSAIRVPSMNISKSLPSTGETDIDLGTPEAGKLAGTCGMGMYPFEINFKG